MHASPPTPVRVRVAPSPTGDPHVGTGYVALINALFARKFKGSFVFRLEDTDQARSTADSEAQLREALTWLGLEPDESPWRGGAWGPYRQSERLSLYHEHVNRLLESGHAYRCFCSAERLQQIREHHRREGLRRGYDGRCADLLPEQIAAYGAAPHVVRMRVPRTHPVAFDDGVRGTICIDPEQIDDQVLLKSDGFPTYHLASVVDDHLMEISHVIRAEEWISSTPKHVLLYQAFGWSAPQFFHLPLLRNADGSKISKRKNPVSLLYYRDLGILPEAMRNFLALLGTNLNGPEDEILDWDTMTERIDLKQIRLGGPVFDLSKLRHLNQGYLQQLGAERFAEMLRATLYSPHRLAALYPMFASRLTTLSEFHSKADFLFSELPSCGSELQQIAGTSPDQSVAALSATLKRLEALPWDAPNLQTALEEVQQQLGLKPRHFLMPLRLAVTGRRDSPDLVDCLVSIGPVRVRQRLEAAICSLESRS